MSSFTSDDRGVTGSYTDIPAIGLIVMGLMVFAYLVATAYSSYASSSFYASEKDDLRAIAIAIAGDPAIAVDGIACVFDARKLDSAPNVEKLQARYGHTRYVSLRVEAGDYCWKIGSDGRGTSVSISLPVTIRLNDATYLPGSLVVTGWERG